MSLINFKAYEIAFINHGTYGNVGYIYLHLTKILIKKFSFQAHHLQSYSLRKMEKMLSSGRALKGPMALSQYPCNVTKIWPHRSRMRSEFTFSQTIQDRASERLQKAIGVWQMRNVNITKERNGGGLDEKSSTAAPLVVGVHVRRSDYQDFFRKRTGGDIPGVPYFEKAFVYFREK